MRLKLGKIRGASVLKIKEGSHFREDVQRMKKRGKSLNGLKKVIELLAKGKTLSGNYKDHTLAREWSEYRECHIEADFLLIYKIEDDMLILERIGTHKDLF
ncbi:type II toxin-antitoxin system YafQ family toxin [candidate division KSB1 bacterium]|nr:type II toxin-antitoxin system YafQ family toxin [candidate division KSB1 bacterium]